MKTVKLSDAEEAREATRCFESAVAEYEHFADAASGKRLLGAREWLHLVA